MNKIAILNEQLSNQIAAGEVVERPASVVKELVENAIDANSTIIKIEVEDGGLQSIRITDNGDGIDKDDCERAFQRHATSKIKHERDLFAIRSLGFRGEALPSIASVSKTDVKTCTGDGPGTHIEVEAGDIIKKSLANSRKGTEITVSKLFFNTPARLKYLKTVHTELSNISDVVNRLAMAHPEISFQLLHNGKEMLKTNGNNELLQVIASIYGLSVAKKMVPFAKESLDFKISGFLAKPEVTRSNRKAISIFINGRYIRNYAISNAIIDGYHTLLPIGRFPIVIIHIKMDPSLIDVNVHPSKLEARVSKENELNELIRTTIKSAFKQEDLIPEAVQPKPKPKQDVQGSFDFQFRAHEKQQLKNFLKEELFSPSEQQKTEKIPFPQYEIEEESDENVVVKETMANEIESQRKSSDVKRIPPLYPIGQMHGTYILAQNETGLYLIDQHAAQERIKYEFFREKVGEVTDERQELLVPITFEFSHQEAILIHEKLDLFKRFGIFFESFGDTTFIVRSHPQWFPKGQEENTIRKIVELILEEKNPDLKKLREDTAIMMSCKLSIKANHFLRNEDMVALLESLRNCIDPYTCPHGRPVLIHFSTYELEKMFKRVM
ncbi:DNA mismatch repair endonuclease MutL [Pueribacillus theae]|uniref:DNA mismatch repair protein MutL n=1 Tax=Pueribacillus theae TaxID=2171751 RepID=A0A2U1K7U4_9BACI|nr:DNA mismatch repair endonuclease MutL [Pueribacillus theae]PWA13294.1 DNA mismatch repair endonuclease MutL [Pueribacillus theae]